MGLDMWSVKLKDDSAYDIGDPWDLVVGEDNFYIDKYISKENIFYDKCLFDDRLIYELINCIVLLEMNSELSFCADPIMNPVDFKKVASILDEWVSTKWNNRNEFKVDEDYDIVIDCSIYSDENLTNEKFVRDVNEYIKATADNGGTMWFSW